jgi:hypothetical protein
VVAAAQQEGLDGRRLENSVWRSTLDSVLPRPSGWTTVAAINTLVQIGCEFEYLSPDNGAQFRDSRKDSGLPRRLLLPGSRFVFQRAVPASPV